MIHHANDSDFTSVVPDQGLVLVDFHASWCGPCKAMAPALEAFAAENPGVTVVKVDVDEAPEAALGFRVRSVPTLVLLRDSSVVSQRSGAMSKAQLAQFCASGSRA